MATPSTSYSSDSTPSETYAPDLTGYKVLVDSNHNPLVDANGNYLVVPQTSTTYTPD